MMRPRKISEFKQSDVRRLVAGARQAGLRVKGLTVDKDGKITVTVGDVPGGDPANCDKGEKKLWDARIQRLGDE
jgi:hypothetical protein